jgi:hypothetical protein
MPTTKTKKTPVVKNTKKPCALESRINVMQINQTHLGIAQTELQEAVDMYASWSHNAIWLGLAATAVGIINSLLIITLFLRK